MIKLEEKFNKYYKSLLTENISAVRRYYPNITDTDNYNTIEEAADTQGKYTIHHGDPVVNAHGGGLYDIASVSLSKIKGKDGIEKLCEVRHYVDTQTYNKRADLNVIKPVNEQTIYIPFQYNKDSIFANQLKPKYQDASTFKQDLEKLYEKWLVDNKGITPKQLNFNNGTPNAPIIGTLSKASIQRLRDLIDSMK